MSRPIDRDLDDLMRRALADDTPCPDRYDEIAERVQRARERDTERDGLLLPLLIMVAWIPVVLVAAIVRWVGRLLGWWG